MDISIYLLTTSGYDLLLARFSDCHCSLSSVAFEQSGGYRPTDLQRIYTNRAGSWNCQDLVLSTAHSGLDLRCTRDGRHEGIDFRCGLGHRRHRASGTLLDG